MRDRRHVVALFGFLLLLFIVTIWIVRGGVNPEDGPSMNIPISEQTVHDRWGQVGFHALLPEERDFLLIWWLDVEVLNGGFHQYFLNETGNHAEQTLAALEASRAVETAELLRRAMAQFQTIGGYSPDRKVRHASLPPVESFDALTSENNRLEEPSRRLAIDRVRVAYIKHRISTE